jgi:hypothetical protein
MNFQLQQDKYFKFSSNEERRKMKMELMQEMRVIRREIKKLREKECEIQLMLEGDWVLK